MYESTERKQEVGSGRRLRGDDWPQRKRKGLPVKCGAGPRLPDVDRCGKRRCGGCRWKEGFRSEQGKRPPCPSFHSCSLLASLRARVALKSPFALHPPSILCVYRHQPITSPLSPSPNIFSLLSVLLPLASTAHLASWVFRKLSLSFATHMTPSQPALQTSTSLFFHARLFVFHSLACELWRVFFLALTRDY